MDWCPPWYRIIFSVFTSRSLVTDERKCTKLSVIWNLTIPTSSPFCLGFSIYTKLPMNYSSPGEGNGNPLQYSCLAIPMDRGAWKAVVHGVASSQTGLSDFTFTFHFQVLEKEMATHSSILAWRIPGMGEAGGLPSLGSHRIRHNWSDLVAAAASCFSSQHWEGQGELKGKSPLSRDRHSEPPDS